MDKLNLYYIGNDDSFIRRITECSSLIEQYISFKLIQIEDFESLVDESIDKYEELLTSVIILDLDNVQCSYKATYMLRNMPIYKHIPCVIAYTKITQDEVFLLNTANSIYLFMKGEDEKQLLFDLVYFSNLEYKPSIQYATAYKLQIKANLSCPGKLLRVEDEKIDFYCDTTIYEGEELTIDSIDINDLDRRIVTIDDVSINEQNNHRFKASAKLPVPEAWNEEEGDTFQTDSLETWIQNNEEVLTKCRPQFLLLQTENSLYKNSSFLISKDCDVVSKLNLEEDLEIIETLRPDVIIFNLDDVQEVNDENENSAIDEINEELNKEILSESQNSNAEKECPAGLLKNNLDTFDLLVEKISSLERYNPIILIFNSKSSTQAFKRIYGDVKLIASESKFNFKFISELVQIYMEKMSKANQCEDRFYVNKNSSVSYFDFMQEICITSLSEHKITFTCKRELPHYSMFFLKDPFLMALTIVPACMNLDRKSDEFHYMALFHGFDSDQKMEFRKLVRYFIANPTADFDSYKNPKKEKDAEVVEEVVEEVVYELGENIPVEKIDINQAELKITKLREKIKNSKL